MSLDGISGWNYNEYLCELDPKKTTTTNFGANIPKQVIPQIDYQTTPIGNVWGQPTSGIYTHSQYPTSLGQSSVFTQPSPLSAPTPTPAPTAAPVSNPTPKSVPTSGIYPAADGAEYARMLENNPLPQQATATTPKAGLQPVRTWAKYAQEHGVAYNKPPKSGAVLADEIAAQKIAENEAKQTTIGTPAKKPYVAPSLKPASITTIDAIIAETQQPIELVFSDEVEQKRVKTPEQRAAQLKRIRSNPEARAKYKNLKLKNNPELASRYESYCKTVKNSGKLKALKKAGKWGALAAIAIGAVAAGVKACSNDKKDDTVKPETAPQKPSAPAKDKPATSAETTTPAPAEEPVASVDDTSNTAEIGIGEFKDGKYKVKKGDCFWIIAEKNLIEEYQKAQKAKNETIDENYKPTDAEIIKETERLVEKNGYEYDEKHWNTTKPISEGDILNIAA